MQKYDLFDRCEPEQYYIHLHTPYFCRLQINQLDRSRFSSSTELKHALIYIGEFFFPLDRDSVVGIATRLRIELFKFRNPVGENNFRVSHYGQTALGPTQTSLTL